MKIKELVQSWLSWITNLGRSQQKPIAVISEIALPSIYATGLWEANPALPSDITIGAFFIQDTWRQQSTAPETEGQSLAHSKDFF